MVAIHLAKAVGGDLFLGFISAVAFATILAVVSGLTLAGASAVSHDLYASVFRRGRVNEQQEIRVSKMATVALGILAIVLGIAFEQQNIAFMVGLAFAIAASANFPIIVLSMFWSKLTTRGALIGGFMGLISATVMVILGPTVWESVLGNLKGSAPFPYDNPAIFSVRWPSSAPGCSRSWTRARTPVTRKPLTKLSTSAPRPVWARKVPQPTDREIHPQVKNAGDRLLRNANHATACICILTFSTSELDSPGSSLSRASSFSSAQGDRHP